jgi:hypothetical protein
MEAKVSLIRGIIGDTADDTYLRELINDNGGDLERALDSHYHLKKPGNQTTLSKARGRSGGGSEVVVVIDSDSESDVEPEPKKKVAQGSKRPATSVPSSCRVLKRDPFATKSGNESQSGPVRYFLGRRTVMGYTLSRGFALRCQSFNITLEGVVGPSTGASKNKRQKTASNSAASNSSSSGWGNRNAGKPQKKDKHAGSKLLFKTFVEGGAAESERSAHDRKAVDFTGRMPSIICDFLVPLTNASLIHLEGHVTWDVGSINTFVDVPLSVHIYSSADFFDLSTVGSPAHKRHGDLVEKANDLLLWLQEGEDALKLVKQQRDRDRDTLKARLAERQQDKPRKARAVVPLVAPMLLLLLLLVVAVVLLVTSHPALAAVMVMVMAAK